MLTTGSKRLISVAFNSPFRVNVVDVLGVLAQVLAEARELRDQPGLSAALKPIGQRLALWTAPLVHRNGFVLGLDVLGPQRYETQLGGSVNQLARSLCNLIEEFQDDVRRLLARHDSGQALLAMPFWWRARIPRLTCHFGSGSC